MPQESTSRRQVLQAIEHIPALSDLVAIQDDHFKYELDLEVVVYGRNYNGKNHRANIPVDFGFAPIFVVL